MLKKTIMGVGIAYISALTLSNQAFAHAKEARWCGFDK
jgi:hypothetical protein